MSNGLFSINVPTFIAKRLAGDEVAKKKKKFCGRILRPIFPKMYEFDITVTVLQVQYSTQKGMFVKGDAHR